MTTRKSYDSRLKVQVALEALKNQRTITQIASEYGVHPNIYGNSMETTLVKWATWHIYNKHQKNKQDNETLQAELYRQIGQLKVELDWLKKKSGVINWAKTFVSRTKAL